MTTIHMHAHELGGNSTRFLIVSSFAILFVLQYIVIKV
jgi:hypothetical protein